jgi:hypothetical protein
MRVSVICAVTINLRRRTPLKPVPARSRSDDASDRRPACHAGARPLKTPAITVAPQRRAAAASPGFRAKQCRRSRWKAAGRSAFSERAEPPPYSATMSAQHTMALHTLLHRPNAL